MAVKIVQCFWCRSETVNTHKKNGKYVCGTCLYTEGYGYGFRIGLHSGIDVGIDQASDANLDAFCLDEHGLEYVTEAERSADDKAA